MAPTTVLDRPAPPAAPDRPDERINRVTSIPFLRCMPPAPLLAVFTGVSPATTWCSARSSTSGGCSSSPPATTATSRIAATSSSRVLAVRHGVRRHDRGPEGSAVVGGAPPRPPPLHRHRPRRALAAQGLLVEPRRLDPLRPATTATDVRRHPATSPRYPELRFLDRHDWIGPWALGIASYLIGGWSGLVVGFFCRPCCCGTARSRSTRWPTCSAGAATTPTDTSRNSSLVALVTVGEGWHNNHHHYQASARQGFFWWEIDPTYYVLRVLSWVGVVRGLRTPSERVLKAR